MKRYIALFCLAIVIVLMAFSFRTDFLSEQKKYERVRTAYAEKQQLVTKKLKEMNIDINSVNILITAFKHEKEMVIYAKDKNEKTYKKLQTYSICASSGDLGPKRKQGDGQVPEGFYYIEKFNPSSSYYLSLGVSYPNKADKIKSTASNLGGDIFIHGECVTIGCMPMTNDKIKEIYIYALQAHQCGQQKIPVYIFPYKFSDTNIAKFKELYKKESALLTFWNNLHTGYEKFNSSLQELNVAVDKSGNYTF